MQLEESFNEFVQFTEMFEVEFEVELSGKIESVVDFNLCDC